MDHDFRANPVYSHPRFRIVCGDCLDILPTEPVGSVDCVVTSPPFWRVRDFGGGLGMEDDLDDYLDKLISVFRAVRRVLKPTGTVWVEFGDAYNNGVVGGRRNRSDMSFGVGPNQESTLDRPAKIDVPFARKSMLGLPWRFALRMIDDGWCLRNVVCWARPAPLPEAVVDRLTRAWTPVFLFVQSERYYFDLDAVRVPQVTGEATLSWMDAVRAKLSSVVVRPRGYVGNPRGRNPGDVWMIPPDLPDDGTEHPARFPEALVALCLLAGCPQQVCSRCGTPPLPSRRGLEPSCGCGAGTMPGLVLDPFAGSGTTPVVALRLGYRALALDIHLGYCETMRRRCMIEASKVPIAIGAGGQGTGPGPSPGVSKPRALSLIEEESP